LLSTSSEGGIKAAPSDAPPQSAIVVDNVWLRFHLQFYKKRVTLRGAAVSHLSALLRGRTRARRSDEFWALRGVTLQVSEGEVLGVIGSNGAGKSTLLRTMAGIYAPDRGTVSTVGTIATLLSFGGGFDLRRPGRDNVYDEGILLGLTRKQMAERMDAIIEMSGLEEFIDAPVMTYSSGMRARLGFSIAVHVDPDILLVDEVVGAGDEKFRSRVGTIFDQLSDRRKTIVYVTHNLGSLRQYCSRAVWLEAGKVRMTGRPQEVAKEYVAASRARA
jgi:ABC-type polysaccharide/polyol phosphate transport system ATPase subunit